MTQHSDKIILVTGGAGFIGSHLATRLLADGYRVRVLDNLATGKIENLAPIRERIEWINGSMTDSTVAAAAVSGVDCIFHEAAIPSVPRSIRDPLGNNEANINGALNILCAAREAGVRRLVYAASSSAYGNSPVMPKEESMATDPISPYAVAKLASELYCRSFTRVYGFETVCLRYFNVFGPRQDPQSEYSAVIPRFISLMLAGHEITIYGDGEQSRDFTYIDNVVDGNMRAMTAPAANGEMCNLACGGQFTLNQLVADLADIMGVKPKVRYAEARAGDVKHSLASIDKARRLLNYEPLVSFRDGLERTVAHFESCATAAKRG
jgi:nucleoside-diphosphate-sugar epimerase